jgi:hypothetical protein
LMRQPVKVATPEELTLGLDEHVRTAPPVGGVTARVTEGPLVTVLPPASWTVTTGCVAKAMLRAVLEGEEVNASLVAVPVLIVNVALTALVSPPAAAVNVYVPLLPIRQPAKVTTPETALLGFVVQARVAPAGVVMLRVTEALPVVTVLPPASWTVTTGCVAKAVPPVEPDGLVVKASLVAGPIVMVKLVLTALVSPLEVAVNV